MLNIFEQPWTLLLAAILAHFALLTFRTIFPEKRRRWHWLVPAFLVVAAFGLDALVQTDLEKIKALINTGNKAVEQENCNAIAAIISDSYRDSYHRTKGDLMYSCTLWLSEPLVEKAKNTSLHIEVSPPKATVTLTSLMKFDKESSPYRNFKSSLLIKMQLRLQKEQGKKWLINRVELLELDRQTVNWRDVK